MIALIALIVLFILIGGGMWLWPILAGILGVTNVTDKAGALRHIGLLMQTYEISPIDVEATFREPIVNNEGLNQRSKNGSESGFSSSFIIYSGASKGCGRRDCLKKSTAYF